MKKYFVFAITVLVAFVAGSVALAGESHILTSEEYGDAYIAPKVMEQVRPERVFYMNNREVEGYVTLEMFINSEGEIASARVMYTTSELAVDNALEAIEQWKFEPATVYGQPVGVWVAYNLPFGRDLSIFQENDYDQKLVLDDDMLAMLTHLAAEDF